MEHHITIARPAEEVFAYLADPRRIPLWLPQLRRDDAALPTDGLHAAPATGHISWHFAPPGAWHITPAGDVTTLALVLDPAPPPPPDPSDLETLPERLANAAEAALHSIKSHLEGVGGGDPTLPMPSISSRAYGHAVPRDEES